MRKPFQLILLLLGVLTVALPVAVLAQDMEEATNGFPDYKKLQFPRATSLRTSNTSVDPETVWIGHIADPTWRPRDKNGNVMTAASFPTIATGGYGPYHVGRGNNRPGIGPGTDYNGVWDWDSFQPGENDSLMGWWPMPRPFQSGDGVNTDDKARPFYGLDYGNIGNYSINQGAPKRTFGVTGYWHRDIGRQLVQPLPDTGAVIPGPNVEWKPIAGTASAWCGLRAQGDATHIDPITLNAYNQTVVSYRGDNAYNQVGSLSSLGTDQNFPGYGNQWDQMLYQDVVLTNNSTDLTLTFKYATAMSRVRGGTSTQRIGYFYMDPTKTVAINDGNFISATDAEAAAAGPVDSFMVYVGLPVNDASCRFAGGTIGAVYDQQRRWFSEVLQLDNSFGLGRIHEVLSVAGSTGAMAGDGTITPVNANLTVPASVLSTKLGLGAGGGTVRLVFRIKTNRGSSDEDYGAARVFTSQTRGAAIIDDVSLTQGGANLLDFPDFENGSSINNSNGTPATAAWKSTGKPAGNYVHVHTVNPAVIGAAVWNDPCSPPVLSDPSASARNCNMVNNTLTGGDHDNVEKPGGAFGGPDQDRQRWAASPTINLKSNGSGDYNAMGIDAEIANTTDILVVWDYHSPGFRGNVNGNFFAIGLQSYPALQANGLNVWGETRQQLTIFFQSVQGCFTTAFSPQTGGLRLTSNANGVPDSIRVYFQFLSRCFTFPHTSSSCSPVAPNILSGNHVDNLSIGLIRGVPPAGLTVSPWFKYVDAFPATNTTNFLSSNFDTTSAWVRSAQNQSLLTGLTRPAILGDSVWIQTGPTPPGTHVDLIFRILPGVGNYVTIGNRSSALRRVPTSTTPAAPNASSTNFWESYLGNNGTFGTPGGHGGSWKPYVWNSARMDTLERNLFASLTISTNLEGKDPGQWMTTYHESDPKFATLGVAKNRCFVVDPSVGRGVSCNSKTTTSVISCNVICGTHPVSAVFPPVWTEDANSGVPPSENSLPPGQTYEYTKIIPDGQLTPGAHVQYFFRREPGQTAAVDFYPDTHFVNLGSFADGARWHHFSVLPDRWKDPAFSAGGTGMACMLVDDVHDRTNDEFVWVSMADSIGLTDVSKRGAHNGWSYIDPAGTVTFRADNGGQPGSRWDLWNTTAGESQTTGSGWLASRSAQQPGSGELLFGKAARTGPTADMLRNFYRNLVFLTGSITSQFFGRVANRTDDELGLLNDFAIIATGTAQPRTVYVMGAGFTEDLTDPAGNPPDGGVAFLGSYFGTTFRNRAYRTFSGNQKQVAQYNPAAGSAMDNAGASFGLNGMKFGVSDGCGLENDVLLVNTPVTQAVAQVFYENVGASGPYIGAIYAPAGGGRLHTTYLDGSRIQRIGGIINYNQFGEPIVPVSNAGLRAYMFKSLSITAGLACPSWVQSAPVGVGDDPNLGVGSSYVNFLGLKSSNPMRSGEARIVFGLAKTEKVEVRVYDVTGRLVRTVANRTFAGGQEHTLIWDGTNEAGTKVTSGVYFYQLRTPTWTSQKKLAVLAN